MDGRLFEMINKMDLKHKISSVIREAKEGVDSWGEVSHRYRTDNGTHVDFVKLERKIHNIIDGDSVNIFDGIHHA
jgi:hypothetical protein